MSMPSLDTRDRSISLRQIWYVLLIAFMLVLPLTGLLGPYYVGLVVDVLVLALFATSFNILWGYTGLLSFGHTAYYGLSAYTIAIIFNDMFSGIPGFFHSFIVAVILGTLVATVGAAIFGALCVQRDEFYFAMLTLAFNMMLYLFARTYTDISGGVNGLSVAVTEINLGLFSFSPLQGWNYYYFSLVVITLAMIAIWRIVNSPYGDLLKAIRESPERAEYIGVRVKYFQWSSFVISGFFAGLAGALGVVRTFLVSPDMMHWSVSADPVFATLIGGSSVFAGPTLGALVLIGLEIFLTQMTEHWHIALGLILIPLVLFAPKGILGTLVDQDQSWSINEIQNKITSKQNRDPKSEPEVKDD
ncbi:branched-chain amino acid ABC transporter permease [Natrinema halophilum]|uniref:branched-chain amino acid ABC transporter permease n=1 Tax=Natrinema halophilum TaxID=1699371 RepID=UPI001F238F93|nr:branched-chain amino acid ABC transporter permease [Natrinema halophilum]UHQ96285.1 branched-chain amino acid ABC transporter permease [Natrinema halophilum]